MLLLTTIIMTGVAMTMMIVMKMMTKIRLIFFNNDSGLRTRTVHCIQAHSVVDEKLCDAAVSLKL